MILIGDKDISAVIYAPSDGVVEVGQYLDFHKAGGDDKDYSCRLQDLNPEISRRVSLPTEEGTLALSKDISQDVLKKNREDRKVCSLRGSNFDENHWYPCDFDADPNVTTFPVHLIIHNTLNTDSQGDAKPSWSTNGAGFSLFLDMEIGGSGWGQIGIMHRLNDYIGQWGGETAVGSLQQITELSKYVIYLRGGADYYYTCDCSTTVLTPHDSEYTVTWAEGRSKTFPIKDSQDNNFEQTSSFNINLKAWNSFVPYVGRVMHTNEYNFLPTSYSSGSVYMNYRSIDSAATAGEVTEFRFCNGRQDQGLASINAAGFFKNSDIRLKSNIEPLKHSLDQICNIPTVEFDMRDKHQIGTIAQSIESDYPELVSTDEEGIKSVQYDMLSVVAIEGIKLLKQEIEDLKKQVEELKNGMCNAGNDIQ